MELRDLQVFRTVVEAGGVIRAAERLHRVQSNVTARIRKLEEELGVDLFLREGRGLRLTASGQLLLDYARRLLALAEQAKDAVQADTPRGVLRLGAMESAAAVRLPRPLSEFHQRYPDAAIELHSGPPRQLTAQVLAGELDAALVLEPVQDARLMVLSCFEEPLVIVAAADHPRIDRPGDVRTRTLLAFHPGCPHRDRLERWFSGAGVPPERLVEVASYHAILGCAAAGMGVALMPASVLDSFAERGRISVHALGGEFATTRTAMIWRHEATSPAIRAFAELLTTPVPTEPPAARAAVGRTPRRRQRAA